MINNKPKIKLKDLRGVGDTVSKKLVDYYGSEALVLNQISKGNILSLIDSGLTEKRALNLVKTYNAIVSGVNVNDKGKLNVDMRVIYDKIIKSILSFACTQYSTVKIHLNLTVNTEAQISRIKSNQKDFTLGQLIFQVNCENISSLNSFFTGLKPFQVDYTNMEIIQRTIATTIPELKHIFTKLKISKFCPIKLIHRVEELGELDQNELILFLTEHDVDHTQTYPNLILLPENAVERPWNTLLPEKILFFFQNNRQVIRKIIKLSTLLIIPESLIDHFPTLTNENLLGELKAVEVVLDKLDEKWSIHDPIESELIRLRTILEHGEEIIERYHDELNLSLEHQLEKLSIKLEGKKVIELLKSRKDEQNFSINQIFEDSLRDRLLHESTVYEEKIFTDLQLSTSEIEVIQGIFLNENELFPIEMNEAKLERLFSTVKMELKILEFTYLQKLSTQLDKLRPKLSMLVQELLEIDYYLTLAKFSDRFSLNLPEIITQQERHGLMFSNGKNMFLVQEVGKDIIIPITYTLGNSVNSLVSNSDSSTNLSPNDSNIVLLSGANSGGKTSILQLIAQIILLGQMGMGVPAETCKLSCFDQLFYYQKPTGSTSAGAFETTLKNFSLLIRDIEKSKLILADEMEAISEPNASAKVISAFLDALSLNEKTCGVFVSHLAEQISKQCKTQSIRIDGIDAIGLDEKMQLLVDRNPKLNHHAKSAPQLIIESLVNKTKDKERVFFQSMLEKFNS